MDTRAYLALYLGGTPSQRTGTSPLAVYSQTTVYISAKIVLFRMDYLGKPEQLNEESSFGGRREVGRQATKNVTSFQDCKDPALSET